MEDLADRRDEWSEAVNSRDVDTYADLVADDVIWIPPNGAVIAGREQFRAWLAPFFEDHEYNYRASNTAMKRADPWVVETSDFESVMTPAAGGTSMSHTGRYLAMWRRDAGQPWRIDRYVDLGGLSGT